MTLQEEEASTGLSEQEGTEGPRPPPPDFGRSVNPITSSGGTDYAHQNITLRFLLPIRIGPIIHTVCLYHTISTIMLLHKKLKIC